AIVGLLAVGCLVTFALWVSNPFAAALIVPGLHLWLLAVSPDLRLRFPVGLAPLGLVPIYYGTTLGYGPLNGLWMLTLLIAGHGIGLVAMLEWSVYAGCVVTAAGLLVALARLPRPDEAPGSVGGTD